MPTPIFQSFLFIRLCSFSTTWSFEQDGANSRVYLSVGQPEVIVRLIVSVAEQTT